MNEAVAISCRLLEGMIKEIGVIIGVEPLEMLITRLSRDEKILESLKLNENFSISLSGINSNDNDIEPALMALKRLMESIYDFSASIFGEEASRRMVNHALSPLKKEVTRMRELNLTEFLPDVAREMENVDKKRQIEDIMNKTRKEQVIIIFEDLLSAWIADIKSLGMIELYKRKIDALASPGSIYSFIHLTDEGRVDLSGLNEREIDDQRLINELLSLFDSFIDTASFLLGKKEVLNRGASAIKPVLDRFHPLTDELGIHDMILKGYLAKRIPSGVKGFDQIIEGGFPRYSSILLQGPPGREKEIFSYEFVRSGLLRGYSVMVILSKYTPEDFRTQMRDLGLDTSEFEEEGDLVIVDWNAWRVENVSGVERDEGGSVVRSSRDLSYLAIAVNKVLADLEDAAVRLAVVDVLSPALKIFDFESVYTFTQSIRMKLRKEGVTALFLLDKEMHDEMSLSSMQDIFDGLIEIERQRVGDRIERKIGVIYMDRTYFESGYKTLEISREGIRVVSEGAS